MLISLQYVRVRKAVAGGKRRKKRCFGSPITSRALLSLLGFLPPIVLGGDDDAEERKKERI